MSDKHKINAGLNKKVLILIAVFFVVFQIFIMIVARFNDGLNYEIYSGLFLIAPLPVAILAFFVGRQYSVGTIYRKPFFALSIAFGFLFLGELTWLIYENILHVNPYPSIVDVMYFAFYPLTAYFIYANTMHFRKGFDLKSIIILVVPTIIIITIYILFSWTSMIGITFDFLFGLVFISASTIVASFALIGVVRFRSTSTIMGSIWLLITISIFLHVIADIWYYYLEIFSSSYTGNHPVNAIWITSWIVLSYALFKHKQQI